MARRWRAAAVGRSARVGPLRPRHQGRAGRRQRATSCSATAWRAADRRRRILHRRHPPWRRARRGNVGAGSDRTCRDQRRRRDRGTRQSRCQPWAVAIPSRWRRSASPHRMPSACRSARSRRPTMSLRPRSTADVQRAFANRRWTGSWQTMFLAVDRSGGDDDRPGVRGGPARASRQPAAGRPRSSDRAATLRAARHPSLCLRAR